MKKIKDILSSDEGMEIVNVCFWLKYIYNLVFMLSAGF